MKLQTTPVFLVSSRFNKGVTLTNGKIAVYNTFSSAFIIVPRSIWDRFLGPGCRVKEGEINFSAEAQDLLAQGLLVDDDVDELDSLRHRINKINYGSRLKRFTILPTLNCNLRCSYCFERQAQDMMTTKFMSEAVENALLHHIARQCRGAKKVEITWTGGEPLLAMETISRMGHTVRSLFSKADIHLTGSMVTNGTLLTPKIVKELSALGIRSIQLTVDVPLDNRCDAKGSSYFMEILDRLSMALTGGLNVHLRVNVLADKEKAFDQLYKELYVRGIGLSLSSLSFAWVEQSGKGGCNSGCHKPSSSIIQTCFWRETQKAMEHNLPVDIIGLNRMDVCGATDESNELIDHNGNLYKCWNDIGIAGRAYGSVLDPGRIKNGNLIPWLMYDYLQDPLCHNCILLPKCCGGCPHKRRFKSETMGQRYFCTPEISTLESRIIAFAANHGKNSIDKKVDRN